MSAGRLQRRVRAYEQRMLRPIGFSRLLQRRLLSEPLPAGMLDALRQAEPGATTTARCRHPESVFAACGNGGCIAAVRDIAAHRIPESPDR